MTTWADSFESGFGNWSNESSADTLDWTRLSGSTGSGGTGPSSAADGIFYLYLESSSVDGEAVLNFDNTLSGDARISFQYHMWGDEEQGIGVLMLEALVSGSWIAFWAQAKNQGNQWNIVSNIIIPEGATDIRFVTGCSPDFQIDVAIDDITVEDSLTLEHPDYSSLETATNESFEDGTTGIFTNDNDTRLIVTNSATPSNATGPSAASDGNYFCFLESSDAYTDWKGAGDVQQSYTLTLTDALNENGGLISFDEHRYGGIIGGLVLWYSTDSKSTWNVLWAKAGQLGNQWNSISEFGYPEGTTHLKFEWVFCGNTNSGEGDLAIDNIVIQEISESGLLPIILTADGITTGAPVLGTPALGQTHILTALGITAGVPDLGTPAIGQIHELAATGITTGLPTIGTPMLSSENTHDLIADNIVTGVPALGTPALGQTHELSAENITAGVPVLDRPEIGQIHILTASGIVTGIPDLGAPILGTDNDHHLTALGITTGLPTLGAPSIGQVHILTVLGITTGLPVLGSPSLDFSAPITPANRIYLIPYENRVYSIDYENRTYSIT